MLGRVSMPADGQMTFPPKSTSFNSVVAIEYFMESSEAVTDLNQLNVLTISPLHSEMIGF